MQAYKITLRILSIIIILGGIALFILAGYISGEVEDGKGKVKNAQENVDLAEKFTSMNRHTKRFGRMVTEPIQDKIDQGRHDIRKYEGIAGTMNILAICCVSIGPVLFIVSFFPRKRK